MREGSVRNKGSSRCLRGGGSDTSISGESSITKEKRKEKTLVKGFVLHISPKHRRGKKGKGLTAFQYYLN